MTWRDTFRPIIAEVIARHTPPESERGRKLLDAALRDRWRELYGVGHTQGSGASWQYKVWRDEIALQTGKRKRADRPRRRIASRTLRKLTAAEAREWLKKQQLKLFGGEA